MARKVPDDVQKVFDKYTVNFVRKLKKEVAIEMFQKEFDLDPEWSEVMFHMFDKDRNDALSIWEFYLFFQCFGYDAKKSSDFYQNSLAGDGSEEEKASKVWDFLSKLTTQTGRHFESEEIHDTIKNITGPEKHIDQQKFIEMVCRIRLTRH